MKTNSMLNEKKKKGVIVGSIDFNSA